jgi:hypothetical protein
MRLKMFEKIVILIPTCIPLSNWNFTHKNSKLDKYPNRGIEVTAISIYAAIAINHSILHSNSDQPLHFAFLALKANIIDI